MYVFYVEKTWDFYVKIFFRKLKKYGFRRLFLFLLITFIQKIRSAFYFYLLSDNTPSLSRVKFAQPAQFVGKGKIKLKGVNIGVWPSPNLLQGYTYIEARGVTADIEIDEGTCLNNGAVIMADKGRIKIGKRCLIGLNFSVVDSDFHGLDVVNRSNGCYECADVHIGDDVFMGNDVKILKGVSVGNGSVIGSGSLVVKDVPAMMVYAGVPAKFVRSL